MDEEPDAYQTYILRLWRARCKGRSQCRASLESPYTGERQVFGSLEQLLAFLNERYEGQVPDALEASGTGARVPARGREIGFPRWAPDVDGARWAQGAANGAEASEGPCAPRMREERGQPEPDDTTGSTIGSEHI